ncbi:CpXC domain-containing protein [Bradyrhizobium sp. CCGUVB4N]|uniref:CpXC domain-containing protein n=1 Tax=Bradyrhizobium sp. CCGUVB4N TaxID=2949631 RepID=UPI0020B425B3|nr:CpXC domain-containing protein [Bradyrhizobium sp. CCGUVB4N]MCP3381237.1 CpXC domain-containing protein [Bradyrhizobium sp. CCGUVB4N]
MDAKEARDRVRALFETAITSSYDTNEVVSAFWVCRGPLAKLERDTHPAGHLDSVKKACQLITKADVRPFLEGTAAVDQERDVIAKAAEQLQQPGLRDLASLFRMFLAVVADRMEEPPEPSHCKFNVKNLTCNSCGYVGPHRFWHFVNTTLRPELEELARTGALCEGPRCTMCDEPFEAMPFFYCNPGREEFIAYWPRDDDAGAEPWAERSLEYIEELPPAFKGGKTEFGIVLGMPVALYVENFVGAVTVVRDKDQFVSTVSEPVNLYVEHYDLADMQAYFDGKSAAQREDWKAAAGGFAKAFLLNQGGVNRLEMLSGCLKSLGRHDDAKLIEDESARLRERLVTEHVTVRIGRPSIHWSGDFNKQLKILQQGLPSDWGFSALLDRVREISRGN